MSICNVSVFVLGLISTVIRWILPYAFTWMKGLKTLKGIKKAKQIKAYYEAID